MNRKERKEKADAKRKSFKHLASLVILNTVEVFAKENNLNLGVAFRLVIMNIDELVKEWVKKEPENAHFIRPAMNSAATDLVQEIQKRREARIEKANHKN
jgi:hypothetical protein